VARRGRSSRTGQDREAAAGGSRLAEQADSPFSGLGLIHVSADRILTISVTFQELFSSRSCRPEKIRVVINSPDETIFRFQEPNSTRPKRPDPSQPFLILYHGSLLRRNGLDLAVDALEIARKSVPGARLVVCGAPTSFFETVMQSVRERGLAGNIHYLGSRNLEQIVEAISRCDLGVVPNHRNVFTELNTPTRIFECLAMGKPVIAPRARGIQDYFGDEDLIYFNLGSAKDLAEKITYAFFHPSEVQAIVHRGQKVYLNHRWTSEKSNLLNAFAELVKD
jgi:glycosyltransferase involved in cell wall biosynthesis